jgi:putative FmdB family regulatory protein
MPIYEYACNSCDHELEIIQKMSDDALEECPSCHNNTLKKQISASAFQLKGTGWYETDFKDKKSSTPPPSTPAPCSSGSCPS